MEMKKIIDLVPFEPRKNYDLAHIYDISILIKTLEREDHLIQLLYSIQKFNFNGPIFIGDDSKINYKDRVISLFPNLNIEYLILPYDTGTAVGRNLMLDKVKTPYFLLCDDDFVFDKRSRLPLMKKLLEKYDLDLLGGVFIQYDRKTRIGFYLKKLNLFFLKFGFVLPAFQIYEYYSSFSISDRKISFYKNEYFNPVTLCDLTHNFFLARTDKVKIANGWNPVLKGGEHQNFFIRAKLAGLKVGTTNFCGVLHDQWTPNSTNYQSLRNRGDFYKKLALNEFGIDEVIGYKEALGEDFYSK